MNKDPQKKDWREISNHEWKTLLPLAVYEILRIGKTEIPTTSTLLEEKREGVYCCAGCQTPLFKSDMKYTSGTGWPSFYNSLPSILEMQMDFSLGKSRIEYHCAICGGHQGHVFDDGPEPTGLRYCNNGIALIFKPTP